MARINIVHIPYKGNAPALTDTVGGQVQLIFSSAPAVMPQVKAGRLRALAVTSAQPSALVPGLPTIAASGVPGYESDSTLAMFAPTQTPAPIVNRLNQEIVRFLRIPEIKEKFLANGAETVGSSPEELANATKAEIARMSKVIKEAGIRED